MTDSNYILLHKNTSASDSPPCPGTRASLSPAEIEKRFLEIDAREPEQLTAGEAASLAAAEAMDDGTSVTLEDFREELEG